MNIERRGLMSNSLGLVGALIAVNARIVAAYVVDEHITVLKRADGSYSFHDHNTGKVPNKDTQAQIIKEIKERNL